MLTSKVKRQSETFSYLILFKKITTSILLFIFSLWNWGLAWVYSWWLLSSGITFIFLFQLAFYLILITHHQTRCLPLVNTFYLHSLSTVIYYQHKLCISAKQILWFVQPIKSWCVMDRFPKRQPCVSGDNSQSLKHPQHPLINIFHERPLCLRHGSPLCNWTQWK